MKVNMNISGVRQGWQCPICGRVYSPDVPTCFGHARKVARRTSNTDEQPDRVEGVALRSAVAGEPIAVRLPGGVTVAGTAAERVNVGDAVVRQHGATVWHRKAGTLER